MVLFVIGILLIVRVKTLLARLLMWAFVEIRLVVNDC